MKAGPDAVDYYEFMGLDSKANEEEIRKAYRSKILKIHPDKQGGEDSSKALGTLLRAFEVLSDKAKRSQYDDLREAKSNRKKATLRTKSKLKHVTESTRPIDRARSVLFYLLNKQSEKALQIIAAEPNSHDFMDEHLEEDEFIDCAFLLAEALERHAAYVEAHSWYQRILDKERARRYHRPCLANTIDRMKELLLSRLPNLPDPRQALDYLSQLKNYPMSKIELGEMHKRKCHCYLELGMLDAAATQFRMARMKCPQGKGMQRLEEALEAYL